MPRKRSKSLVATPSFVTYRFEDRTYEIDPQMRKVYRRFVEIETSKAAEIFSHWRAHAAA